MKRIVTAALVLAFATVAQADGGAMFKGSLKGQKEADVLKIINEGKGKMKPVKIDDAAAVAKYVSGLK